MKTGGEIVVPNEVNFLDILQCFPIGLRLQILATFLQLEQKTYDLERAQYATAMTDALFEEFERRFDLESE